MLKKIPAEILIDHTAIVGKTGSGKTSTEKLIVEQVAAEGARVCILDPIKSDWWGLTSSADGKKPGLPFRILGGPRGHLPLHSSAGKALGALIGSGKLPLSILDMADFEAGGLQRFFADFAPSLMRHMTGVLYLVIEEAHEFAPKERAGFGAENMAIHYAKRLATAGRSKGIRLIVATQRVQKLHNDVLGSCETLIAHRLTTPADQKPVLDWLKANADRATMETVAGELSSLKTGSGWICVGAAQMFKRVEFPKFRTYDNAATPTGDDAAVDVKTAAVDQEELRSILGDAVKEAEANDPKNLKKEIARLTAELQKAQRAAPAPDPAALDALKRAAYHQGTQEAVRSQLEALRPLAQAANDLARGIHDALALLNTPTPPVPQIAAKVSSGFPSGFVAIRPAHMRASSTSPSALPPGERAVLIAACQYQGVDRDQLSVLTGYKRSSRDAYIARLREKGLIEISGQTVTPTQAGVDALGSDYEPLPTGQALQDYWFARLPEGERRILMALVEKYPSAVDRSAIDQATGFKRSTRDAYIQRLKSRRLVEMQGSAVAAAACLF